MGTQQLSRDLDLVGVVDAQEHDRQIAGYPLSPQSARRPAPATDGLR
jgi:hypothetical protein